MKGERTVSQEALFYGFSLEEQIWPIIGHAQSRASSIDRFCQSLCQRPSDQLGERLQLMFIRGDAAVLHDLWSMKETEARRRKGRTERLRHSQSLASRRHLFSQRRRRMASDIQTVMLVAWVMPSPSVPRARRW